MRKLVFSIVLLIAGTLLFQSFQCASPELTTARLKYRDRLWNEAEDALNRELAKNPKNGEALYLMADTKFRLNKIKEAAEYAIRADKAQLEPKYQQMLRITEFNIWSSAYNEAIEYYNKYFDVNKKEILDTALYYLNITLKIRPEIPEFYRLKGLALENMGEKEESIRTFLEYEKQLKNEIEYARNSGIHLFLNRDGVFKKIGKPKRTEGAQRGNDSLLIDIYSVLGNNIYIFYVLDKEQNEMVVEGWNVSPPRDWLPNEITSFSIIDYGPFGILADYYYNEALEKRNNENLDSLQKVQAIEKNLNKAKKYVKLITELDPTNIDANRFLVNIYDVQGQTEEALEEAKKLAESNPNNKFYVAQYGDILFRLDKYDESIEQFKKALEIDPEFCDVARNMAAAYKNKAATIQKEQQDKHDKDKNYQENPDEYIPFLEKAAKYFEQCRSCKEYKNDLVVLSELAAIYDVLNKNDEIYRIIDVLERLEQVIKDNEKDDYWLKMCKIYGSVNSPKSKEACQKATELIK